MITNGLRIASDLAGHPGIIVLMLGGRVRWEALSVVGQLGDGLFRRVNVQKAFLGAAGFTPDSGLADATDEEAQIKRSMVAPLARSSRSSTTRSGSAPPSRRSAPSDSRASCSPMKGHPTRWSGRSWAAASMSGSWGLDGPESAQ